MRIAILSDIHGNLAALKAVLTAVRDHNVDLILVAGDFVGGPQPNEAIASLRGLHCLMILGNTDINLLRYASGEAPDYCHTHLQWGILRWTHRHIDPDHLRFLKSLPKQRVVKFGSTAPIRMVHGSPRDPYESIFPDRDLEILEIALSQVDEPVLVCGHTHIPWALEMGHHLVVNPGAVCGQLNGDTRARYAILEWIDEKWSVCHHAVLYDLDLTRTTFHESGFLDEGGALARCFLLSVETGQNVAMDFLTYAYGLAAEAGEEGCEVVPDPIWEQAAKTFEWPVPGTHMSPMNS